ncbi:hypothetical protein AB1Y20_005671 [Prymnesium parvum]|uniref:Mitochondrial ribonuclease P catalytic subunit n=1 Tax=Prymnesium parvum TaxID=97485 RepID=A0AB34J6F9_PRYPA
MSLSRSSPLPSPSPPSTPPSPSLLYPSPPSPSLAPAASSAERAAPSFHLYPPREKASKRLWHQLSRFRKDNGKHGAELQLPPENSYLRACAHDFAERLGLLHTSIEQGDAKAVRVSLPQGAAAAASGEAVASAAASRKRKADEAEPPPRKTVAELEEARMKRSGYLSRLRQCVVRRDAAEGMRVFHELQADGLTCTSDNCSLLIHLFLESSEPMLQEALQVFAATMSTRTPDESSWSGMVKLHCQYGSVADAIATVDQMMKAGVQPRLRTFSPLLAAASASKSGHLAEEMIKRVRDIGLSLSATEYISLAALAASDANPRRLHSFFEHLELDRPSFSEEELQQLSASLSASESEEGWRAKVSEVDDDGFCSVSKLKLHAVDASDEEMSQLRAVIPRLVNQRTGFYSFVSWLDERISTHGPFDFVLDGANIGFFGQGSFIKGKESRLHDLTVKQAKDSCFSFAQVDAVLRAVLQKSSRVLLVLHVSHTQTPRIGPHAAALIEQWRREGWLYTSPAGHNDDWYWLYAAIAGGKQSYVISNDEMRDHHFGMLAPRSFMRWKEQHVIHFNFKKDRSGEESEPAITLPPRYSRQVQVHECGTWHLPSAESSRWLCVWHSSAPPPGQAAGAPPLAAECVAPCAENDHEAELEAEAQAGGSAA